MCTKLFPCHIQGKGNPIKQCLFKPGFDKALLWISYNKPIKQPIICTQN